MQSEKQDILTPLPKEWKKPSDLKNVVLHQFSFSPPCRKITAILDYHKIPYQSITGKKKDSAYKMIPVLLIDGH